MRKDLEVFDDDGHKEVVGDEPREHEPRKQQHRRKHLDVVSEPSVQDLFGLLRRRDADFDSYQNSRNNALESKSYEL